MSNLPSSPLDSSRAAALDYLRSIQGVAAVDCHNRHAPVWMQTRDGHAVDLLALDLSQVSIREVAHSLARIARFTGHTNTIGIYSVAQHSVQVAEHLRPEHAFWGLMHDAHEAIMGDVSSPVKAALRALGGAGALARLDEGLILAVRRRWGLTRPMPHEVRVADMRALATERRDLLSESACPWNLSVDGEEVQPWTDRIFTWTVNASEQTFLRTFIRLRPDLELT